MSLQETMSSEPGPDPLIGKEIAHCRIERKLGAGGMGAVYLARHAGLNKPVAIKVLPASLSKDPDFISRFLREARLAARLEHPNVIQVFDVGEEEGVHYISMQYVEGRSLDAVLKERKKLAVGEALAIAKRVAVALGAAHKLGIVHRDIKPANILISKDGVVKVGDFGLAKDQDANRSISETGQILGTPYYMSPEQAQAEKVDARSDLYSLGATLYHMLSGRRPHEAPTPLAIVVKVIHETAPVLREADKSIPEAVSAAVARLLAKKPEERFGSAEELVRALDGLKGGAPSRVQAPASKPDRRAAIIALPIAGILTVGIVLGLVLGRSPEKVPPPAPKPVAKPAPPPPPTPPPAEIKPAPEPPKPPAAGRRETLLGKVQDAQERRLTEELLDRADELLKALQKKDVEAIREILDRLTFGELSEASAPEIYQRALNEKTELLDWEIEDVQLRPRTPGRPPGAVLTATYRIGLPNKGEMRLSAQPMYWIRRLDGKWYATRPPPK
jgi:serine/threonine protein kinase